MSEAEGMSGREQHIERGRDYLLRESIELRKQAEAAHLEVTNLQTQNAELRERVGELLRTGKNVIQWFSELESTEDQAVLGTLREAIAKVEEGVL